MNKDMKIILASNSPRRKELLGALEIDFEVRIMDGIDETYPQGLTMTGIPEHISSQKAAAYALGEDELLIAADTIVYLEGEVLAESLYHFTPFISLTNSNLCSTPTNFFIVSKASF